MAVEPKEIMPRTSVAVAANVPQTMGSFSLARPTHASLAHAPRTRHPPDDVPRNTQIKTRTAEGFFEAMVEGCPNKVNKELLSKSNDLHR